VILRKLADYAATLPKGAGVARIGLADLAYPRSQSELKAMGGFAAMLLTVICVNAEELPVSKVEMRLNGREMQLAPVVTRLSQMPVGTATSAYGRARFDAVYLVPVFMTRLESTVVVSLGAGARTLTVLRFPSPPDEDHLPAGLDLNWPPFLPEARAIRRLIDEELPVLSGIELIDENARAASPSRP
jgi:hypothetical protein